MSSKIVVITGASRGIGAAVAERLAARGDSVVLVGRRSDALRAVADRCQGRAQVVAADVTRRAEVQRVVRESLDRFGRIDVWINNVGQGINRNPSELTDEDIDTMVTVNLKSALYGMQEVLPHFKERNAGQIINVSSVLGRMPLAIFRSAYNGAKHFLNALTANLRAELKASHPGIRVSLVSPGLVATEFGLHAVHGGPDSRTLPNAQPVDEVAAVIVATIDSGDPDVYTRAGSRAAVLQYLSELAADPR